MKLILYLFTIITSLISIEIQKPIVYDENTHDIKGWFMSEKLDGVRAYWTGKELLSKNGNKIYAPKWFIKEFPSFELDGELWTKRADFENIQSIVLSKKELDNWKEITYNIFEVPKQKGNFEKRLKTLKDFLNSNPSKYIKIIPQIVCRDENHLNNYLQKLLNLNAEGIILKNPHKDYFTGRNENVLKVKKFEDMEGIVISHNFKNDEFKSLKIALENNVTFNLGNGFTKKEKLNPPNIGDVITFKYFGFTKNGKPKFASFLRVRQKE